MQLVNEGTSPQAVLPAAARVHTLLKTRHSNPAWFRLGAKLFTAMLQAEDPQALDTPQRAKVQGFLKDMKGLLAEEDGAEEEAAPARGQTLAEMLGLPAQQVRWRASAARPMHASCMRLLHASCMHACAHAGANNTAQMLANLTEATGRSQGHRCRTLHDAPPCPWILIAWVSLTVLSWLLIQH